MVGTEGTVSCQGMKSQLFGADLEDDPVLDYRAQRGLAAGME
jgi:hypothetical protein